MVDLSCPINDVAALLPHSGKMVLLDRVIAFGEDFLIAESELREDNILLKNNRLPSFVGTEIMAQGVAAWAGCKCIGAGQPISLGYWIGSRKLSLHCADIPVGSKLTINIRLSIEDASGFGIFDCQLIDRDSQQVLIEGALSVFRPQN